MDAAPDRSLDRYEVIDRIAVGGMAEVFKAKAFGAHGFEKILAIKRILPELARDSEFEKRFIIEAKVAVQLAHANIVQVFDFGRVADSLFIAMEFIDGLDMAALIRAYRERQEHVPLSAALHIAIEMCKGLDFAHQRRVVHRDVSPSNVLLSRAGEVKIADFGIALPQRQTVQVGGQSRRIMGKWRYMSPEQALGENLESKSDLFSAGVVMFELFTGQKLFPGSTPEAIIDNITNMPIPRPSDVRRGLPALLDEILLKALQRDLGARWGRAADMQRALTECSYESSIVSSALDVEDAVTGVLGDASLKFVLIDDLDTEGDGDRAPARGTAGAIDSLIRQQLGDAFAAGARGSTNIDRRTAVDAPLNDPFAAVAAESGLVRTATSVADGTDPENGEDGPAANTASAIIRRSVDSDGMTRLEIEPTVAARPASLRSSAERIEHQPRPPSRDPRPTLEIPVVQAPGGGRRRGLSALVAAITVVAVGGAWLALRDRQQRPAPPRTGEPGAATAEPRPPEALVEPPRPTIGKLRIDSDPQGATVRVDGETLERPTPTDIEVDPAKSHIVEFELEGHRSKVLKSVAVGVGETLAIIETLERQQAVLVVKTRPPGAQVELDGEVVGTTPLELADVAPGTGKTLVLRRAEYKPVRVAIDLADGERAIVDKVLQSAVEYVPVQLLVTPWADVYFRGKKMATVSPKGQISLPTGRHKLELRNPSTGKRRTVSVVVRSEGDQQFVFEL